MDNLSNDKMNLFLRKNYPDDGNRSPVVNTALGLKMRIARWW